MLNLPEALWCGSRRAIKISEPIIEAYFASLQANQLWDEAAGARPDPAPVGGLTKEQTDLHFAHAFDGSVARAQLALLDPYSNVPLTSEKLLRFLSGGRLCLADLPCGAGAASLAFLGSVYELRRAESLPRVPLHVHVIGGEISGPARTYAEQLFGHVTPAFADQAIFLTYETCDWDVLSSVSTTDLVRKILQSPFSESQTLIVVCNFNGFLERSGKKEAARPQLEEVFRYCSGRTNGAVWIEPQMNAALNALFPWLRTIFTKLKLFLRLETGLDEAEVTECLFELPVKAPATATARLAVLPIDMASQS